MGLLDMPISGAPKRIKPPVDMAGRRKPIRKIKRKPKMPSHGIDARVMERVKHSL
jgi:hypothetical protein